MKRVLSAVGILLVAIIGLIIIINSTGNDDGISPDSIIELSEQTGNIPEKIIGNPDEASLIVYEYADYGCSHCADWNRQMNELVKKHDGKLAIVFRGYNLGFQNGLGAAHAATAAQIQGYFKEYKDLLFANQSEWIYAEKKDANDLFVEYFKEASNDAGDVEKFKDDMNSSDVKKRLDFEHRMGKKVNLQGTPLFRINGENVSVGDLVETIEELIP
ncbi:thioredoxin domain-containing protein [Candidatus Saccharibacteria bacterium]|nr:thioredoxin domain-containing protein [Candidatus Saccharibacteria bacterium]